MMKLYTVIGTHKATNQEWKAQFIAVSKSAIERIYDLGGINIKAIIEETKTADAYFIKQIFGKEKLPS